MQSLSEMTCSECDNTFLTASSLLQHFASHVTKRNKLPNLHPIISVKNKTDNGDNDSGIEDVNPIKYCLVTMEDKKIQESNATEQVNKKYQCSYCLKRFGWSTDLKRHILIHTGEKPFQCNICEASYTRNFLLQKHVKKMHDSECNNKSKIPDLTPIQSFFTKKHKSKGKFNIDKNKPYLDYIVTNL